MPNFKYVAMTEGGSRVSGSVEAESQDAALQWVAAQGYIPSKVSEAGGGMGVGGLADLNKRLAKVKAADIILFTKQFRTMFDAGLSIVNVLEVLEQQTENAKLKDAIIAIAQDIRRGQALHEAFSKHPRIFTNMYCAMLRAGEASGTLSEVLERLIYLVEHEYKVKKDIKSAMTYPVIVIVVLFGAFIFLLTYVIPQFVTLFAKAGLELPLPTRVCIAMYEILRDYWYLMLIGCVGIVFGLISYVRTSVGRLQFDTQSLRIPIIGPVLKKSAMSRFASIFALLQASGVSVLESIRILSAVIGNMAIANEFDWLRGKLEEGRGIAGPLKNSKYFTPMIINMIAIGEETGNLEDMLREVANHYDYEVEYAIGRMSELIGPVMVLLLAVVVGFFAMSIILPIYDLVKMAH